MISIEQLYEYYLSNPSITTDTRNIKSGDIFFALKGDNFNGNLFAEKAIELGAKYVIIDEGQSISESHILVEDVLTYLQQFARHHRNQFNIPFVGITGTNGKTTSKELINAILERQYKVAYTHGNLNNHIGVPLTILNIPVDTEIAIIEMGASHKGNIEELCNIANPSHGVITNIGKAHLEGFGDESGVLSTKSEIYQYLIAKNGIIWLNEQDDTLTKKLKELNFQPNYYNGENSLVQLDSYNCNPFLSCKFKHQGKLYPSQSKLFGEYNALNICLAIAIGVHFKMKIEDCIQGIENYTPSNNRSEIKTTAKGNTIILDAYNANPSSLTLACNSFFNSTLTNKHVILGDMLELGEVSTQEHRDLLNTLPTDASAFLVGKEFKQLESEFKHFNFYNSNSELIKDLEQSALENASFLIKGSRGIKLENVVQYL
ncbi:UDP-N-acetylmuramoyl-tripeptide--D-alanyl-D-alanine ligase [Flavobacteriales bacterium]|nr:UDP-N-acetylmuramoyl-tripeptide--D-alanyl-D-alanine ligase [Flavobacteriales bacterium]